MSSFIGDPIIVNHLVTFSVVRLLLLPTFFVFSRVIKVSVRPPFLFLSCLDLILGLMTHQKRIQLQGLLVSVPSQLLRLLQFIGSAEALGLDHTG